MKRSRIFLAGFLVGTPDGIAAISHFEIKGGSDLISIAKFIWGFSLAIDFYNKKKFDLEVYAVSADTSMVKMRNYIKEMNMRWITVNGPWTYVGPYQDLYDANTTPTVYVLDKDKNRSHYL